MRGLLLQVLAIPKSLMSFKGILVVLLAAIFLRLPAASKTPTVQLDQATFIGAPNGTAVRFLGIPYGKSTAPPNRFKKALPTDPYTGVHNATAYGPSCPQQDVLSGLVLDPTLPAATAQTLGAFVNAIVITGATSEDCLSVNVIVPANIPKGTKLPVIVWTYGGGFMIGGTVNYDGTAIVKRSIELGQPAIFVSMNYRVSAWGFIGGKEVNAAGVSNLGLRDQRLALQWVQKYIGQFGGDPTKVLLWGESAGANAVAWQMLLFRGQHDDLFRAVFMESGSAYPSGDASVAQVPYDALVQDTGCSNAADTLACLAALDMDTLSAGVNKSPTFFQTLNLPWQPRVDNDTLPETAFKLITKGEIANVPFINGDLDDEGTTLSFGLTNVTTDAEFQAFIKATLFPDASAPDIQALADLYSPDPAAGSPFGTGTANAITPEYKRLAAIQGDYAFEALRRFLFNAQAGKVSAFSYLIKRNKSVPIVGSSHGSDLPLFFQKGEMQDYLIHFAHDLDPNSGSKLPNWPRYDLEKREMVELLDGPVPINTTTDTFRVPQMQKVIELESQKV